MAWFKKDKAAGPVATPATLDRVAAYFDANGLKYDREEDHIQTGMGGVGILITENELTVSFFTQVSSLRQGEEAFEEMLDWCEAHNNSKFIPCANAHLDPEDNYAVVRMDMPIPRLWDYTDAQFEDYVMAAVMSLAETGREFFKVYDPKYYAELMADEESMTE